MNINSYVSNAFKWTPEGSEECKHCDKRFDIFIHLGIDENELDEIIYKNINLINNLLC